MTHWCARSKFWSLPTNVGMCMEPTTLEDLLPHLVALIIKTKRNKQKKNNTIHKQFYFTLTKIIEIFKQQKTENKPKKNTYNLKPEKKKRSTKMHTYTLVSLLLILLKTKQKERDKVTKELIAVYHAKIFFLWCFQILKQDFLQ